MKLCLLLMFGGLCRGDILNLGYLPPPGAKVSGGSDGALDVPLETPFKTPQSSFQSNPIEGSLSGNSGHEDKKTYGTTPPSGFHEEDNFTAGTQPESVNVPTTTTSFAFTQTTTFSPLNKIQCDEPHCISENKFPTSSFPISQIPSDISQKISNAHTPQSNAYKPIPQFQSPEIGSATPGLVSNTYGTTFQPNHDSSQTQDTVDTQSPSAQSFPPGSIIGSFQPHLNESYRPGGIAPLTQLPSGKENYVNNFPGTSALPQFTRAQSVLPAGITVVPMSSFKRPGFGTQPSQYPGAQVTDRNFLTSESDNIPAKDGQPGDKYVVPGSFPSITSPKIFSQQPIIPHGFPNVPTSGAITVIPTGSSEGLTSDGQIQYPGSHPVVPGFTVGAPGSYYNKPHQSGPIQPVQPFDLSKARFDGNATILKYDNIITPEGYFSYSFDTSNGIHADESGDASDGVKAEGAYSYTGDDGQFYSITYTADENGYQPKGDHLPTPPPIPEAIQRVIEQSTRDKAAGIIPDQGLYNEDKYGYKKYNGKLGQDSPFKTQTSGEIGSNNINTRRPIAPDRRPSNSGISPNLAQPSVSRTPGDMLFGQTTLRPTYSNKYNIPDQGIDKKIGSHKPTKYLPEYSSSPTIYGKPFDYNNRGTPTATGKNYSEIRPNIPQGEPTLAVGSRDQTEQGEPNLTESQTTSALNLFRGTGTPSKNVRPIQQGYDQFGQPISNNNYPSKPNIPIKKGQHYGSSGRPIDEKNASIVLNEGKFPERIFYKKNDQFIQRNGPSGIRDGMPSEQGNDGRIPGQGGTDGPTSEDFIVPVEVQYDDAVYRGNSQIIPISSPGVTTLRPISYFTDNGSRIRSENEFVKGEDSTNKPIAKQPQEFYQKNAAVNNRFPPLSERQGAIEKVNAGMAMTTFVPSPSNNFPQRQQTNAIVRPYDRTITRPISGYKYEVPSQRFDMDVSERYQPEKKITSFGQVPRVSETLEDGESESTAAPSSTIALEDVYQSTPEVTNSGIIVRPTKKPGRPSPGSAELFNITPDTLDTTVTATDSPMGQRFSATSPRPKPVTTNRGNIRYEPVSSEVSTIIPDGSKRVTNIPEFSFSASRHTSSTEPDPSEDVQGEFVTSMPEYNHFSYKQKIPQPGTTAEDVGIYGTAPTQTYGEDFVQAQPSTPKTFQVPKIKPQHTYPESHFMSSTLVPEDPASSYLGYTQDYKHSSTIKPFGSQFGQQRPSRPRVSGYPTTQRPGFTSTETTQYTTSRPGYIEKQSTFTPTTNEQIYPGEDQRFEQKKGDGRYHQSVVMPHELIRGESEHEPGKFVQKVPGELEFDQTLDQFRSDQPKPGKFGLNKKPPNFGSDKQILGPSETSQQIPGKIGSEQHKPGNVGLNKQKPEKFESEQQRTMQFGLDQHRPGQFGSDQQRTEQFRHDQQIPGKFGLEQQQPIKSELDQYKPVQFGSDQQRRGQFGFGQQTPGKIGSDQQRPGEFRLDQQGPGQFGSDEQLTGQFKHEHQKPGKFGLEQQESDKFRFDQQGPGQYELDQQRPGKLGSEQQRPVQFGLDKQRPGQFGYDQQGSGQIELDQQRPGTFGSEQQRPAQFGLDKQRPGQFGSDQPIRGQFGFGQHKPGKIGSEQQRPGEFGLDQHGPGQYELDQQRPGKFGSEQQRPGQFGLDKQRPGQFGSDQQISGQFGSDQQIPGEYGLEQQRPVKFGSEQPIPGQFGLDKQRPGQFGSDQQEPGQFGSRVTIFPKIKGETFSPSRKPPSYDAETGYHY